MERQLISIPVIGEQLPTTISPPMKRQRRITTWESLPDVVIGQIQALIPPIEAARSCVVSKSFRRAWSTTPNLIFRQPRDGLFCSRLLRDKFLQFVTETLTRYGDDNLPLLKLDIQLETHDKEWAFWINKWVGMALRCGGGGLRELRVSGWAEQAKAVGFYPSLFLGTLSSVGMSKFCQSLASLELCHMKICQGSLLEIFQGFPSIQKIVVSCCTGFNHILLENMPHLKQFEFTEGEGYIVAVNIINTPRLLSFCYTPIMDCFNYGRLLTRGVHMSAFEKLEHICLNNLNIDDSGLADLISKLPSLEHLKLHACYSLTSARIVCPTIKYVDIEICERVAAVYIHAPKLIRYVYVGPRQRCPRPHFGELKPIQETTVCKGVFTSFTYLFQDSPISV